MTKEEQAWYREQDSTVLRRIFKQACTIYRDLPTAHAVRILVYGILVNRRKAA
jgi:hypothetical protein